MTTNHLLGYPADARLLIINADDFGMCDSVNRAIIETLRAGMVTTASLMACAPAAPDAMRFLRDHPAIPFAVHLTLISEYTHYRWGALAPADRVASLLDETGLFFADDRHDDLLARARRDEVETECRAQIDAVLAAGLRPTHLDWHCLPDGGRADITDLTHDLATEYGLALRSHTPALAARCQQAGRPSVDQGVLDSYLLDPATKAERYAELLRDLPPGLTEWAVHPSLGNEESRALEPTTWPIRRADYDVFTSDAMRDLLTASDVVRLDYRRLQQHWQHQPE